MLFANVCAGCHLLLFTRLVGWYRRFLGNLGAPWSLVYMEGTSFASAPSCVQNSGYEGVPIAGHARWVEVGGGIICVTLGVFSGLHKSAPHVLRVTDVISIFYDAVYASLSGTAQSPWLLCMHGMLVSGGTSGKLQANIT